MWHMFEKTVVENPLVTAFAFVGLIVCLSNVLARHLTGGGASPVRRLEARYVATSRSEAVRFPNLSLNAESRYCVRKSAHPYRSRAASRLRARTVRPGRAAGRLVHEFDEVRL